MQQLLNSKLTFYCLTYVVFYPLENKIVFQPKLRHVKFEICDGSLKNIFDTLQVVSATFLLVCFVCLKERTCGTRENVFYFTSKALFVREIIKF